MKNILTILILSFSLILASWRSEEPLITKEGICIYDERKGTYYLRVNTETPTEDYEIINPDKFFNDFENCRMKITGKIITVDNVKK
ncbi:hypothetical protein [Brachyspira aalborgi]|uniref:Uncharacterized protein n=1 Tax=Brachyspira aalborgi TaxID=29522 RepID=A0A5C8G7P1_9SPIR|nr:hypothetical protein [Brachyspira aalborgi]TXJ57965.1 hypothetical protein EPJ76_00425 [Brachyspira aalborgi]